MPERLELKCPACGFRVFNRRYPKCEHCGADLPPSVVHSTTQVRALQALEQAAETQQRQAEEERRLEEWKARARLAEPGYL